MSATPIVEISPNDDRKYRYLKLPNEMEVILVEDPTTDKSSACCDVRIGSMADPVEAPG
jgi:secreted Zn-dependent insulinase-like peptidase